MVRSAIIFCSILLFAQQAFSLACPDGYFDAGQTKCVQCIYYFNTCEFISGVGFKATVTSRLVGWKKNSADVPYSYCVYSGSSPNVGSYYNKQTNLCQPKCKEGCKHCDIDYDYCTECENGYTWNNDFTCIPAVIGLQAASLAILVIGLVFGIISCCVVIRAKKN